jgi:hypothetical protein
METQDRDCFIAFLIAHQTRNKEKGNQALASIQNSNPTDLHDSS